MKKAALYIRVSTDAQREEGYSIDAQKEILKGYCISKGINEYEYYIDGGYSGSNIDRPEMKELIDRIKSGDIFAVIVYKLDRLSRSQKDTLYLIEDVLIPNNVAFVSINENMDTSTPIGRAMLGIMSAFAQLEREMIYERTRMGMRERVKNGLWRGGGKVPFGYDYDKSTGKLIPNDDAKTVKQIFSLYLQGYSTLNIAKMTGLKYEKLAIQILKRITYTGNTVYKGELIENTHEQIISGEIFELVTAEMRRRAHSTANEAKCLFAGMIYCGVCGRKMRYQKWSGGEYKIYCYSQDTSKTHIGGNVKCDNIKTSASELEAAVLDDIFSLKPRESKNNDSGEITDIISSLEHSKSASEKRLMRLYNLYSQAENDILLQSIEAVKKEISDTLTRIEEEKKNIESISDAGLEKLGEVQAAWRQMNIKEKRAVLRELIDKIVITYDKVDVYYTKSVRISADETQDSFRMSAGGI